jgi:hypothetical protein
VRISVVGQGVVAAAHHPGPLEQEAQCDADADVAQLLQELAPGVLPVLLLQRFEPLAGEPSLQADLLLLFAQALQAVEDGAVDARCRESLELRAAIRRVPLQRLHHADHREMEVFVELEFVVHAPRVALGRERSRIRQVPLREQVAGGGIALHAPAPPQDALRSVALLAVIRFGCRNIRMHLEPPSRAGLEV